MPLVSVLMPTYNNSLYLEDAIQCILSQTFKDFELIIINDASTDNTAEILTSINDKRVLVVNNKVNLGLIESLNIGLNLAKGKYIARMDGDDKCSLKKLELQVDFLEKNKHIGVCGTWAETFGNVNLKFSHPVDNDDIKSELLFNISLIHATMLARKSLFSLINNKYPQVLHAEDFALFSILKDYTLFANIPNYLYYYRVHDYSVSKKFSNIQVESTKKIYFKLLQNLNITANPKDLDLHFDISKGYIKIYSTRIVKAFLWLNKLKKQNSKLKIYDERSFRNAINKYYLNILKFK